MFCAPRLRSSNPRRKSLTFVSLYVYMEKGKYSYRITKAQSATKETVMERRPGDAVAEIYLSASWQGRRVIADEIARLPHRRLKVFSLIVGLIILGLVITIDVLLMNSGMKIDRAGYIVLNLFGVYGLAKVFCCYQINRPSVYNMLAEYKARHGGLPNFPRRVWALGVVVRSSRSTPRLLQAGGMLLCSRSSVL